MRRKESQALGSMPERITRQVNLLADIDRFDIEGGASGLQNVQRRSHNFRPDAVAVRHSDRNRLGHIANQTFRE